MLEDIAIKRRMVLEKELEDTYEGKLVKLPDDEVVRIETIAVKWDGKFAFTVIVCGNNKRRTYDHAQFVADSVVIR